MNADRTYIAGLPNDGGCIAGVILADGTIVRGEGEPPTVKDGNWFRPSN
jgi:hypothetical protein